MVKYMGRNMVERDERKKRGNSSPSKIFFFRTISKQGNMMVITIPKALYPMLAEGGFLRRKLKITLEKAKFENG